MNFYIYTDASYRDTIACGAIVIDCNNSLIKREIYFKCANSTEAETFTVLVAVKLAEDIAVDFPQSKIFIHTDEQYLADFFSGICPSPKNIRHWKLDIKSKSMIKFRWIERQQNYLADEIAYNGRCSYI